MLVYIFFACNPQNNDPAVTAPLMGGGMAVEENGRIWVSDPDGDRVLQLQADGSVARTVLLGEGEVPNRIAIGDSSVAVVLRAPGELLILDREGTGQRRVSPCPEPRGMLAEGEDLWVACAGGELAQVHMPDASVTRSFQVQSDLRDVVRDGEHLWVSRFRSAELLLVNEADGTVIDTVRSHVVDADEMPVNQVSDPFSAFAAWRTVAHPDGGVVMLHQRGADGPVDVVTPRTRPYYDDSVPVTAGAPGIVHSALTKVERVDMGDGPINSVMTSQPLVGLGLVVDLAVSPQGRMLIAHSSTENPWGSSVLVNSVEDLGLQAHARGPGHGSAVGFDGEGDPIALTRFPLTVHRASVAQLRKDVAPVGFDLFHRATSSGMACASCHMEGHEDGRTWDFAEIGRLRTQELAQLDEAGPFHWRGDLENLAALMGEVHTRRMGATTAISPEQAGPAIAEFLKQVPRLRPSVSASEQQIAAGAALFVQAECLDCHTHPLPTESYDVGTGEPFQVPTLDAMSMRLPLMHDGCATTVRERFTPECGGENHGKVSDLTASELDSLVAYLSTL